MPQFPLSLQREELVAGDAQSCLGKIHRVELLWLFAPPGTLQSARKETGLRQQEKREISQDFPKVFPPCEKKGQWCTCALMPWDCCNSSCCPDLQEGRKWQGDLQGRRERGLQRGMTSVKCSEEQQFGKEDLSYRCVRNGSKSSQLPSSSMGGCYRHSRSVPRQLLFRHSVLTG